MDGIAFQRQLQVPGEILNPVVDLDNAWMNTESCLSYPLENKTELSLRAKKLTDMDRHNKQKYNQMSSMAMK